MSSQERKSAAPVLVIGAGPGGLTTAYELTQRGCSAVVVVDESQHVGGLARTVLYKGFRFDIGGHRFFTKVARVQASWREWLGADLLTRPRRSRIFYRGRFFDYPLKIANVLRNLGVCASAAAMGSYVWARLRPIRPERDLEAWVCNRFGRRLYRMFFKSYTEKIWGMPCREIGADWAAQRIRGLSLRSVMLGMLGRRNIRTLTDSFEYPRLGSGMMWDACRQRITRAGGRVTLGARVTEIRHESGAITAVVTTGAGGHHVEYAPAQVVSTMPIRDLVRAMTPAPPAAVCAAAERLRYRDFLIVALIVRQPDVFPDNWIYIHDPSVRVGRVQNFKNWSPDMVPDPAMTCLGLEYFCAEGDDLWSASDEALVELATREMASIGLTRPGDVVDATVERVPKAYPVYDEGHAPALDVVRQWTATLSNLHLVGRNGMHKYNNQDHSMFTAMLTVDNMYGANFDVWSLNAGDEYLEETQALRETEPLVPRRVSEE